MMYTTKILLFLRDHSFAQNALGKLTLKLLLFKPKNGEKGRCSLITGISYKGKIAMNKET